MYTTRKLSVVSLALLALAICFTPDAVAQTSPGLPQVSVDTTFPVQTGLTIDVAAGGDLQGALDKAQPGDTVRLAAGATFSGSFTLPAKTGTGWIVIRTSAPDTSLPPQRTRISPSYAAIMPKVIASSSSPAIQTAPGAHNYRLVGLELSVAAGLSINYGVVALGDGSSLQNTSSQVPYALVLDRVYIHGLTNADVRRGVGLNSGSAAIIDSYISEIHEQGADTQAIGGWNGPGPYKIANNYLEAAGENILFGGADPSIANLVPSDIEIRGNYVNKQVAWMGGVWSVKNLLELKNAQRVLVDGNIFEHNWLASQNGFSILFTVRNQNGTAPWSVVQDITFTHNIVRHVASGVNLLGYDSPNVSQQTKRILIKDNLFDDVNGAAWGGGAGRLFQPLSDTANVTIDHNTGFQTGDAIGADGAASTGFVYTSNLTPNNQYGVGGTGTYGNPILTLSTFFPGAIFRRNILQGGSASSYPADNFFPATMAAVAFTDLAAGNYKLLASSPYHNAGLDGKDVGADFDALNAATLNTLTGIPSSAPPPPPADTTPPSVSITSPTAGSTVSATITIIANASDNVGVAGVQFYVDGVPVGAEQTTSPYRVTWNTTTVTNSSHSLTATARDAAGNRSTSAVLTVTVSNSTPDTTLPNVSLTSPSSGATVSGTVSVAANATDNVGVAGVQFLLDNAALGGEDTAAPYQVSWDTTRSSNGSHTLAAIARDAAGNRAQSAVVTVTVNNIVTPPPRGPFSGIPSAVPGTLEAEDFDKGGQDIAYHDNTPGNQGGQYRLSEDVDIISPYAGGYVVNSFETGEWMEYTINVTQSATYRAEILASSQFATSGFHIAIDGVDRTGFVTVPNTGLWTTFQWVGKDGVSLTAGQHVVRLVADVQYFNVDRIRFSVPAVPRAPYTGTPAAIPGMFEAEDFDKGGEGVAYHDNTPGNQGGQFRTTEDVDIISPYAGGYVVNNFETGEWMEYTVNVTQTGTYRTEILASSEFTTAGFHISVDGVNKTGFILVPYTGTWTTFAWVGRDGLSLTAGQHIIRLTTDVQYFNVDALRFTLEPATPPPDTTAPTVTISAPANGATVAGLTIIAASATDNVGVAGVKFLADGVAIGTEIIAPPYQIPWDTSAATNATHILTAVARDAAGNATTSQPITVIVSNTVTVTPPTASPDTTPPTVGLMLITNGAVVSGVTTLFANASDDVGVAGVQFRIDGNVLGEVTAAPYALAWNTATVANGTHTITAVARDAAGNRTTSAPITVTVSNTTARSDSTPPTITITSPTAGTMSGMIVISAAASDNVGVVGVQFFVDGTPLGAEVMSPPFQVTWDTRAAAVGTHQLTAMAFDAAGNRGTSAPVSVNVQRKSRSVRH